MLKIIKKLFGIKPDEPHTPFCEHQQRQKVIWMGEESRKAEWEAENERKKKIDAAYLGTVKTAYDGTYEEWKATEDCSAMRRALNSMSNLSSAGMVASQAQSSNVFSHGCGSFGRIF
jgi:hypothetical protein